MKIKTIQEHENDINRLSTHLYGLLQHLKEFNRLQKLTDQIKEMPSKEFYDQLQDLPENPPNFYTGDQPCMHDSFKGTEVVGIACPCPRCTPQCSTNQPKGWEI